MNSPGDSNRLSRNHGAHFRYCCPIGFITGDHAAHHCDIHLIEIYSDYGTEYYQHNVITDLGANSTRFSKVMISHLVLSANNH